MEDRLYPTKKKEAVELATAMGWDTPFNKTHFNGVAKLYKNKAGQDVVVAFDGRTAGVFFDETDDYFFTIENMVGRATGENKGLLRYTNWATEFESCIHTVGSIVLSDDEFRCVDVCLNDTTLQYFGLEEYAEDIKERLGVLSYFGCSSAVGHNEQREALYDKMLNM